MTHIEQLAQLLKVAEITEDYKSGTALEIGEWHTADGYDLHVMTEDPRNLDFEYDVYYYEPSFEQVIERIKQVGEDDGMKEAIIYISDIDVYLPEYEVQDYIEEHKDEENDNE